MSMNLCEHEWLERMELAAKIYSETYTHNTVAINNFILNSREKYTIFSRVLVHPNRFELETTFDFNV